MNIISKLTLRHLKQNKKRTVVTILGIAAATALITTMLVGITSFFGFFGTTSLKEDGNWHGQFENLTKEQIEELKADKRIASVAVVDGDAANTGVRMHSRTLDRMKLGNVIHLDEEAVKNKVTCDYDGTLPNEAGEIAIEEQFLLDNDLSIKPGDSISFDLGARYMNDPDGKKVYMAGNYHSSEEFEMISEETCKVTAILHSNSPTDGFDILMCFDDDLVPKENFVSICLKKLDFRASATLQSIATDHNLTLSSRNTELLISVFSFDKSSRGVAAIIPAGLMALAVIIGVSIILIYNAFGMSLMEKTRYLGMLASVGATKKQKRGSIYFEAFILALFGIPLGIFIGYIGAYFTISILGKAMIDSNMIIGGAEGFETIPVNAPFVVYLFVIVIAIITISISSMVPAIRASKVMPIDALRSVNNIKVKSRKLRINPLIRKIFGYEGELAYKNIKRNGSKATIITLSIAVSVTMFLTIMHFCGDFEKANAYEFNIPYQIYVSCAVSDKDMLKDALAKNKDVTKCYTSDYYLYQFYNKDKDPDFVPPNDMILNKDYLNEGYKFVFDAKVISLCTIPDEDFAALIDANGLDRADYFGDELKGVALNDYYRKTSEKPMLNDGIIGQKLFYDKQKGNLPAVTIGGLVAYEKDNYIFRLVPKNSVVVYVPESMFYPRLVETMGEENATVTMDIETSNPEKLNDELLSMLEKDGYHNYTCGNLSEAVGAMKVVILILKTVMYGFTTLVTLIGLANMVNTIYTGTIMRRKEFAMYRSVGMDERGFNRMLALEGLLYGIRALVLGIPLSILLSYLMTKKANSQMAFEINIPMYLMVITVVFIIIGASMMLSLSKVRKDEIIEVLKEDIC